MEISSLLAPNASVAQKCCRQRCRRPSCIVDPPVASSVQIGSFLCRCDFDVPCDCRQRSAAYCLFTSRVGPTDQFDWFMDKIVALLLRALRVVPCFRSRCVHGTRSAVRVPSVSCYEGGETRSLPWGTYWYGHITTSTSSFPSTFSPSLSLPACLIFLVGARKQQTHFFDSVSRKVVVVYEHIQVAVSGPALAGVHRCRASSLRVEEFHSLVRRRLGIRSCLPDG